MTTCRGEYVSKNCECLPDPMDPYGYVCGYVNIQNGLVYPCDPGCCEGKCNQTVTGVRFQIDPTPRSDILPAGFGSNLPQSNSASAIPGATVLAPSPRASITPVWKIVIVPIAVLVVILLAFFTA
jgi:hypothetical protein